MDRFCGMTLVALVCLGLVTGCGKESETESTSNSSGTTASTPRQTDPSKEPAAIATANFLEAVLKGDSQSASALLTPQAIERIVASGKQFSPPGWQTAQFKITQVRTPSQDHAVVQCLLSDTASPNAGATEEMCCLLRRVENDWRVSGIAYGTGPDKPWTMNDFETGRTMAIPRQPTMQSAVNTGSAPGTPPSDGSAPVGRPSPRTAQEAPAAEIR